MNPWAIRRLIVSIALMIAMLGLGIHAVAEPDSPKLKKLEPDIVRTTAQVVEDEVVVRYKESLLPPKSKLPERKQALKNASKELSEKYHMDVVGIHVRQGIIRLRIPLEPISKWLSRYAYVPTVRSYAAIAR